MCSPYTTYKQQYRCRAIHYPINLGVNKPRHTKPYGCCLPREASVRILSENIRILRSLQSKLLQQIRFWADHASIAPLDLLATVKPDFEMKWCILVDPFVQRPRKKYEC